MLLLKHQIYREGDPLDANFLLAGNGILRNERRKEFSAIVPYSAATVPGLPNLKPQFQLLVPKVPAEIGKEIVDKIRKTDNERLFYLYWQNSWHCIEPRQVVTRISCRSLEAIEKPISIEIHSHGISRAFFSATDNAEENGLRIAIVFGDRGMEVTARVCVHGSFLPIDAGLVLEDIGRCCHVI